MNITLHTRITHRRSNQGKLQSSRNLNILEHEWNDKAVIHSHKEYNKSILKPVVDHSNPSNALLFHSLRMYSFKCMNKKQNQYLTITTVKEKEDYGQYLLHTPESPLHDKGKTPCQ